MNYLFHSFKLSAAILTLIFTLAIQIPSAFGQGEDDFDEVGETATEQEAIKYVTKNKPTIGLRSGVANTDMENYDDSWEYGLEMGFQPFVLYSLAVEFSGYANDPAGDLPPLTRTKLLGKGMYNFGGNTPVIRHSYIGLAAGPVWDNISNDVATELGIAPFLGFDIPLAGRASRFSLGANANYLFVSGGKPETLAMNGMVKYWF